MAVSEKVLRDAAQSAAAQPVRPGQWAAPARYDRELAWPRADFSWIADGQLATALTSTQQVIRVLRHARSDARLTVRETARRARMPHNTLLDLEAGMRWPTLPVLLRVALVLGVNLRAEEA